MKFVFVALAVFAAACTAGVDRYLPKFAARETVASPTGPVVFGVGPKDDIVYVELRTLDMYRVRVGGEPVFLTGLTMKPDSLAVTSSGAIWIAGRDQSHHMHIRYAAVLNEPEVRAKGVVGKFNPGVNGPASRFPIHLRMADDNTFTVGWSHNLFTIEPGRPYEKRVVVSDGWTDPVFAFGRGTQIWVADNALPGSKERVARGREKNHAKRNRFASALPAYTNPSDMVLLKDELLLCSKTHEKVYRLHIGLDEVARRRDWMKGLVCDRDIGVTSNGSLITATNGAIYKYPPR
jgi:hypothetical protein